MEHERCMEESPTEPGCGEMPNKKDSDIEFHEHMKIDVKQDLGDSFVSPTPEKPEWSSKARVIASLSRKQLAEEFNSEGVFSQFLYVLNCRKRLTCFLTNIPFFQTLLTKVLIHMAFRKEMRGMSFRRS